MNSFNLKKELPLLVIVALPFLYLEYIWASLPEIVPIHWNINGEADKMGSKSGLWMIPILLPLLTYVIFTIMPLIDPKGRIEKMGGKFHQLKFLFIVFMSALAMFIIYSAQSQDLTNGNMVYALIGLFFMGIGNYFKTIKANYFIGIRTPWTLESEAVWKNTHQLAGKLWFVGGFLAVVSSFIFSGQVGSIVFLVIVGIIAIVPIVFSYLEFQKLR